MIQNGVSSPVISCTCDIQRRSSRCKWMSPRNSVGWMRSPSRSLRNSMYPKRKCHGWVFDLWMSGYWQSITSTRASSSSSGVM